MNASQRPAVAAIAASLVNGRAYHRIYDHAAGQYREIGVQTADGTVNAFDYARRAHIKGALQSVYDYGEKAFLQLDVDGSVVKGYDCKSGAHFHAGVSEQRVDLYDYQAGAYFIFQVG